MLSDVGGWSLSFLDPLPSPFWSHSLPFMKPLFTYVHLWLRIWVLIYNTLAHALSHFWLYGLPTFLHSLIVLQETDARSHFLYSLLDSQIVYMHSAMSVLKCQSVILRMMQDAWKLNGLSGSWLRQFQALWQDICILEWVMFGYLYQE